MATKCAQTAANIKDRNTLQAYEEYQCLDASIIYRFTPCGSYYGEKLDFKLLIKNNNFAPFFTENINPKAFASIHNQATKNYVTETQVQVDDLISVPSLVAQKRVCFESFSYQHQLETIGKELGTFSQPDDSPPHFESLCRRRIARFHTLKKIQNAMPSDEADIARATQPLPYFIELPLIHWERSMPGNSFLSGMACLSQLLKLTCLFGLEELHAVRSGINSIKPFPKGLLEGLAGKPSLGHWSRCIDHLAKLNTHFSIWNNWIKAVHSERNSLIELIEVRNEISHTDFLLDPELLERGEVKLSRYFSALIPKLRNAVSDISVLLACDRTVQLTDDGKAQHKIRCLNLKSPTTPFPEGFTLDQSHLSPSIHDGQLFASKGDQRINMNNFFVVDMPNHGSPNIFVYDKDSSDSQASMTNVMTSNRALKSIPLGIFSFPSESVT